MYETTCLGKYIDVIRQDLGILQGVLLSMGDRGELASRDLVEGFSVLSFVHGKILELAEEFGGQDTPPAEVPKEELEIENVASEGTEGPAWLRNR